MKQTVDLNADYLRIAVVGSSPTVCYKRVGRKFARLLLDDNTWKIFKPMPDPEAFRICYDLFRASICDEHGGCTGVSIRKLDSFLIVIMNRRHDAPCKVTARAIAELLAPAEDLDHAEERIAISPRGFVCVSAPDPVLYATALDQFREHLEGLL